MADETIRYDVLINARAAIKELQEMSKAAENNQQRIAQFSSFLVQKSREWNIPLKTLLNTFKQLNAELSKNKQANILGNVGGADIFGASKGFLTAAEAAGRFETSAEGVVTSVKKTSGAMDGAQKSAKGWAHGIDVVRTALGTLVAVGIFQFLTFMSESFNKASQAAKQLELALYNIANAERILSKQGIEISVQDITDIVDAVQELVPTISRVDLTNAVSGIALFTKDLGYSKDQIEELSKAIAVLAVRNRAAGLTFEQVQSQVLTGLLTGRAQGIRDLGVSVSETTIEAEALRLHLVKDSEAFDNLTGDVEAQIKAQALLSIVVNSTSDEMGTLNDYLETNDAKIEKNKAAWEDFLAVVGGGINRLLPDITGFLNALQKSVEVSGIQKLFLEAQEGITKYGLQSQIIYGKLALGVALTRKEYEFLKETLKGLSQEELLNIFPDPSAIKDRFTRELIESLVEVKDTATDAGAGVQDAFDAIDTKKAQDEIEDLLQDLETLLDKIAEEEADFQLKLTRLDEDAVTDRLRLIEDYNLDVNQTIRAFNTKRAESEAKFRQKELEDESKFQEQLRQLREKYLFNLEDALRERDARQVLRLGAQYRMDKQALINENDLRKQAAENNHKLEQEQAQRDLQERLRVMAEEQALRLKRFDEEQAIKRQRMEEDHAIEMQRLREQLDERIKQAADKIAEEYGVNAEGAQAIYELLQKYYGSSGAFARLTNAGYMAMLRQSDGFLATLTQVIAQYAAAISSISSITPNFLGDQTGGVYGGATTSTASGGTATRYAKGGRFIATRPTKIEVGEGGEPEFVSITPLSKLGQQMPSVNGQITSEGSKSSIEVMVDLSPDLEARVVNKSMDGTAQVISRVRRSKRQ